MNTAVATLAAGDSIVSGWYTTQNTTTGSGYSHHSCLPYWPVVNQYWPVVNQHWHWHTPSPIVIDDKTKKAFAIAKELVQSKFMVASKIDEFIELVELIESKL